MEEIVGKSFNFPFRNIICRWIVKQVTPSDSRRFCCEISDSKFRKQQADFEVSHLRRIIDAQSIARNKPLARVGFGKEDNIHWRRSRQDL
jgi:hypothetical protein